jgi:hypothetical protein
MCYKLQVLRIRSKAFACLSLCSSVRKLEKNRAREFYSENSIPFYYALTAADFQSSSNVLVQVGIAVFRTVISCMIARSPSQWSDQHTDKH